jgi:hypothetical protein
MKSMHEGDNGSQKSEEESMNESDDMNSQAPDEDSESGDTDPVSETESSDDGSDHELLNSKKCDDAAVWVWIMTQIVHGDDDDSLMKTDDATYNTKKLVKAIREKVEELVKMTGYLVDTDIYQKIEKEKERFEKQGYGEDEATNAAWKKRRYLVKKEVIEPIYQELIKAGKESSDED